MDSPVTHRVVKVRSGDIRPSGSWVYVWIDLEHRTVAYVGGTGFDPELRAYVHLTDDNPDLGRVKAQLPNASDGDFDILAFPLPSGVERPAAKQALVAALTARGLYPGGEARDDEPEMTGPMITAIQHHVASH